MTTPTTPPWAPDSGHATGAAVTGIDGHLVHVRATIGNGPDSFAITGLRDSATATLRDRVRAAVVNSGLPWPGRAITVTLTPPGLPGVGLDLPIAAAILVAAGVVPAGVTAPCLLAAELGLDGALRQVRGVLPAVSAAARAGTTVAIVAPGNAAEAVLAPGVSVVPCPTLRAVLAWLRADRLAPPPRPLSSRLPIGPDAAARLAAAPALLLALQAAAAGGHHLCLTAPRDAGLADLIGGTRGLWPPLEPAEAAQVTAIWSVAGLLDNPRELATRPPWRNPRHTTTLPAMLGGGAGITRPGEAALAHGGVLFLDQATEFGRDVLAALRHPLSTGQVTVSRGGILTSFPARFTLIAAMASCPCGNPDRCSCTRLQARRYVARVTADLGGCFNLRLATGTLPAPSGTTAADPQLWAARVADARERAGRRLRGTPWRLNTDIPGPHLIRRWQPEPHALAEVSRAVDLGRISRSASNQVIRLAWTLADLAGKHTPGAGECGQALTFQLGITC
jgi:magnesium chelatase family protein